jgi:hypothetical protein
MAFYSVFPSFIFSIMGILEKIRDIENEVNGMVASDVLSTILLHVVAFCTLVLFVDRSYSKEQSN